MEQFYIELDTVQAPTLSVIVQKVQDKILSAVSEDDPGVADHWGDVLISVTQAGKNMGYFQ